MTEHGPIYNVDSVAVRKHRRIGRITRDYGLAVLAAASEANRRALQRELPSHNVSCASRTNHNCGYAILAAVAKQNRNRPIRKRSDAELLEAYEKAMESKAHGKESKEEQEPRTGAGSLD